MEWCGRGRVNRLMFQKKVVDTLKPKRNRYTNKKAKLTKHFKIQNSVRILGPINDGDNQTTDDSIEEPAEETRPNRRHTTYVLSSILWVIVWNMTPTGYKSLALSRLAVCIIGLGPYFINFLSPSTDIWFGRAYDTRPQPCRKGVKKTVIKTWSLTILINIK